MRVLVNEHRARPRYATTADVMLDIAFRVKPPDALLHHLSGVSTTARYK